MNKSIPACSAEELLQALAQADRLWLFLDYDGTLAEFAPTPDHILPDQELHDLLGRLAARPATRVAVVSGRRLGHIQALLPVPGVLLAGTYGVEMQLPDGSRLDRVPWQGIRPTLEALLPVWAELVEQRPGYYLEDKGWAIALHGRRAEDGQAEAVLAEGRRLAEAHLAQAPNDQLHLSDGYKFLELSPVQAKKGLALRYLLQEQAWPGASLLYLGDDEKDEDAFEVIREHGGMAVVVSEQPRPTYADCLLPSPMAVRDFLHRLSER